jgi:hypothetical protein
MWESAMTNHATTPLPQHLRVALTLVGINLPWIFFVVWVIYGFVATLVLAALINHAITRIVDHMR